MLKSHFSNCPLGRHLLSCTRQLHVHINFGLLIFAVATLYATITAYLGKSPSLMLLYHYTPTDVMVITGCAGVLALASLLGIYSSIRLSFDGFIANGVILLLLVAGTTGYTIWRGVTNDYGIRSELFKQLRDDVREYTMHKDVINTLQRELSCCGAQGFNDWSGTIPLSCCSLPKGSPEKVCKVDSPVLNKKGCFDNLAGMLRYYNILVLISHGLVNSLQTATAIISYILCRTVKRKQTKEPEATPEIEPEQKSESVSEPQPELEAIPEPEPAPIPEPPQMPPDNEEVKCIGPRVNISNHIANSYGFTRGANSLWGNFFMLSSINIGWHT